MEREVVYKPVIDITQLPEQMEKLQSQLNLLMGARSFSAAAQVAQPFSNAIGGGSTVDQVNAFSQSVTSQAATTFSHTMDSVGGIQAQIQNVSSAMQMGSYKFQNALQLQGLMQPIGDYLAQNVAINQMNSPSFSDMGITKSLLGSFGVGFDPNTMGMTKADYRTAAEDRLSSAAMNSEIGSLLWGGAAGWAAGAAAGTMIGGPVGTVVGAAVGFGVDMTVGAAYKWGNRYNEELENYAGFIKGGSFRFAGGAFDNGQAKQAALGVQNIMQSRDLEKLELTQYQAEGLISEFTAGGGFDSVRSAEEYVSKVKQLMDTSGKVSQLLHSSIKDAVAQMAALEQAGVTSSPTESFNLLSSVEARSKMAGMSVGEFNALGMAGATMMQGTGLGFDVGYGGIQDAALSIRAGLKSGAVSMDAVRHAGGMQNASASMVQAGLAYGTSPMGLAYSAAGMGLGGGDINQVLATAANNITSPQGLLEALAGQSGFIEEQGSQALLMRKVADMGIQAQAMGYDISKKENFITFAMMGNFATDASQAALLHAASATDPMANISATLSRQRELAYAERPTAWSNVKGFFGDIGHFWGGAARSATSFVYSSNTSSNKLSLDGDVRKASSADMAVTDLMLRSTLGTAGSYEHSMSYITEHIDDMITDSIDGLSGYTSDYELAATSMGFENLSSMVGALSNMSPGERAAALAKVGNKEIAGRLGTFLTSESGTQLGSLYRGGRALGSIRQAANAISGDLSGISGNLDRLTSTGGKLDKRDQALVRAAKEGKELFELSDTDQDSRINRGAFKKELGDYLGELGKLSDDQFKQVGVDNELWRYAVNRYKESDTEKEKQAVLDEMVTVMSDGSRTDNKIKTVSSDRAAAGNEGVLALMGDRRTYEFFEAMTAVTAKVKELQDK